VNSATKVAGAAFFFLAGMGAMYAIDRGAAPTTAGPDPAAGATVTDEGPTKPNPGAVRVDLFVMSQCPYGVQAEAGFEEVVTKLGADLDLRVEFVGDIDPSGELKSMHGAKEVFGDLLQACAQKHTSKWFEFIKCQNQDWKNIDTGWEACAKKVGVPADKIGACAKGPEGKELLTASFKRAEEKGATGSPTIFIAGKEYAGGRKPTDFMRAICGAYTGDRPAACNDVPELVKVNVTLLSDKRCAECETDGIARQISGTIGAPVIKNLDYGDPEGKKLFDAIQPAKLPAVIFDKSLDGDQDASQNLANALEARGDHKIASIGKWNPRCADDKGCELDECKSTLACKKEEPNKLEVFVMSQCPFGVKGLDAMKEVLANFDKAGTKIDFQVHYIGNGTASEGFKALHGQPEVDENIRHLCAINHYAKDRKYLDYIFCRNKDYKSNAWEPCTGSNGIDTAVIKKCFEGKEGKELLEKSFAFSNSLDIGGSPTWIANGKFKFSGIDAETIKTNFCAHNKVKGCENKLSGQAPAASNGGAAAPAPGCGE
jgi:hypothetical protein